MKDSGIPGPSSQTVSGVRETKRLSYDAERRILDYLRDGDVDRHDSLRSDVQRLYQEMLTWRIACQRWTPGGSEYMDPAYCVEFIQRERRIAAVNKIELAQLRKQMATTLVAPDTSDRRRNPGMEESS